MQVGDGLAFFQRVPANERIVFNPKAPGLIDPFFRIVDPDARAGTDLARRSFPCFEPDSFPKKSARSSLRSIPIAIHSLPVPLVRL